MTYKGQATTREIIHLINNSFSIHTFSIINHLSAMSTAGQKLNLLSLDGGGIRILSSLYILKEAMKAVNRDCPPKPCDYFDMIGGVDSGG